MTLAFQIFALVLQFVALVLIGAGAGMVLVLFTPPRWIAWTLLLIALFAGMWVGATGELFRRAI